jgi:hypothetical protein
MKKPILLAGLAVLVVLQAAVAVNARLGWRGKAVVTGPDEKVRVLRRANAVFPWNAAVHFELGKAYFERGAEALAEPASRDALFRLSADAFLRSIRLDPGAPAVHFHFAQTLLYMGYLSLPTPFGPFEEYERAARLAGHNSQIRYEVGRMMVGLWPNLEPKQKDFAVALLGKTLAGGNEERLLGILEAWHLQSRDPALIDRILPDDAASLRIYARFLGERALSLDARRSALAKAERLDLDRASTELERGRREAEALRTAEASARYAAALDALGKIRFYQALTGSELFAPKDHAGLLKTARRLLAMSRIEETRSLADEDGSVAAYFAVEDEFTALGEFEAFLRERGLLGEATPAGAPLKDLRTLAFRTALDFHLNRYRDIVKTGDLLESSSLVIAPSGRADYARVLGLIGESNLKLDYVYEAEKFLLKALELEPANLDLLLALERCYGRLNDEAKAAGVRQAIEALMTPAWVDLGGRLLGKGESVTVDLVSDGRAGTVRLDFAPASAGGRPVVSVFLNGRVVWEEIGDTGTAHFSLSFRPGRNTLEIGAVSEAVALVSLSFAE